MSGHSTGLGIEILPHNFLKSTPPIANALLIIAFSHSPTLRTSRCRLGLYPYSVHSRYVFVHFRSAALLLVSSAAAAHSTSNNEWENPRVVEQHKEKPHASFMVYDQVADVAANAYARSPYYQSLNGP